MGAKYSHRKKDLLVSLLSSLMDTKEKIRFQGLRMTGLNGKKHLRRLNSTFAGKEISPRMQL